MPGDGQTQRLNSDITDFNEERRDIHLEPTDRCLVSTPHASLVPSSRHQFIANLDPFSASFAATEFRCLELTVLLLTLGFANLRLITDITGMVLTSQPRNGEDSIDAQRLRISWQPGMYSGVTSCATEKTSKIDCNPWRKPRSKASLNDPLNSRQCRERLGGSGNLREP